jgi:TatD DNase family protein
MKLAAKHAIPVVIHDRDAHGPTLEMLKSHPGVVGVLHSYSGSADSARELMALGYYISFTGVITFKNATTLRSVAETIPLDSLMIETDCPYLTPVPHRGETNHSGYLCHTCAMLAEMFGKTPDEMADITTENAKRFFGVK